MTTNKLKNLLSGDFVFLDGAMGTMLQKSGLEAGEIPEILGITNPEKIIEIHKSYINAGAQIIYTNTFGANRYKLKACPYSLEEIICAAVANAKKAVQGTQTLVSLDIGPIGQLLEPTGTLSFDEAYEIFKEQVIAGHNADIIDIETMTDLYEMKAALLAVKENSDKPVICTMSFEDNMRTFTGCSISSMALTLEGLGADAIGLNCSLGPKEMFAIVQELSKWTHLPIVVKPNAGLPNPLTNSYDITPLGFAEYMKALVPLGVKIFGGCCGTTPEFIEKMISLLAEEKYINVEKIIPAAVCTPGKTVVLSEPRVIGERINPTGKKLFKEALHNDDMNYVLSQAVSQVQSGADILDVNVGIPDIDEAAMMTKCVRAIQSVTNAPLQIDSNDPKVLEAALRNYNGKPIVNSVNGEEKSLDTVLPLVKKYGAAVVGLTLDEEGIPKTVEKRFEIAKKILDRALALGIKKEDVYIDCLTLTVSAEQKSAMDTLNALSRVKKELGLKTVLGVSNISFGLPNRGLINHNFLNMALTHGLDLPIMNPGDENMMSTFDCYKLLSAIDEDSKSYIAKYKDIVILNSIEASKTAQIEKPASEENSADSLDDLQSSLSHAIENGLQGDCAKITEELLKQTEPMLIINKMLIPALDKAGIDFEFGNTFLPQLIQSANASQIAFDIIRQHLIKENLAPVSKGTIIVATVKGDIHDIGKNIVKVLLENYGYNVIDLGKDVSPNLVVEAARKHNAKLVGLSALMTTTLKSMEETIALLKAASLDCKIMVGGAVLTSDYAKKIGADFYAKDAKDSTDIAKKILG